MTAARRRLPLALRIAAWLLPRDAREDVLGDLVEAWQAREHTQSWWARARWTLRQPLEVARARFAASPRRGAGTPTPSLGALRRRRGLGVSWLDVKLGLRMLAKYLVMTLVSGLAIAVTIAVAIGAFSFFQDFLLRPTVPLDEHDGYEPHMAEPAARVRGLARGARDGRRARALAE